MKMVKYFLQKRVVTILLLVLILAGGLFSYFKWENWRMPLLLLSKHWF